MKIPQNLPKKKIILSFFVCTLIAYLFFIFFMPASSNKKIQPSLKSETPAVAEKNTTADLPVRLKIQKLNIDVTLEYVGVTTTGAMDIPKSTDKVGWFELGTRPGEIGTAVMAGHYGLYAGKPSVFDDLHELSKGDKLSVEDENGSTINFVVRETRSFDPQADATIVFSSDDEKSHLNLITCEGDWNKDAKSFSKRLVVFTERE